jgi:alkane 1-monooxygenase
MNRWMYLSSLALIPPMHASMRAGGAWTFFLPVFVFVTLPLLEQLVPRDITNWSPERERSLWKDRFFDAVLLAVVPAHVGLLLLWLPRVASGTLTPVELVGTTFSAGIACGVFGINVGHELGHRKERWAHVAAWILLGTSLYTHFFVEHNRGHHAFWVRSILGSLRSAWELEASRLRSAGRSPWSWDNLVLRLKVFEAAAILAVGLAWGPVALGAWFVAALIGALLLETVNYLEHYGLQRDLNDLGHYERVQPHHSWNSDRPIGRALMFELTRHSDHHANAARPYQVLRHFDDVPELPAGYPAMILAALVPPLFFAIVHPILDRRVSPPEAAAA